MKRALASILSICLIIISLMAGGMTEHEATNKIIWNANGIRTTLYFTEEEFLDQEPDYPYLFNGASVQLLDEKPDTGLSLILAYGLKCYVPTEVLVDEIPEGGTLFSLERTTLYEIDLLWVQDAGTDDPNQVTEQFLQPLPQGTAVQVIGFVSPYAIIRCGQTEGYIFFFDSRRDYPLDKCMDSDYDMNYPGIFPAEEADRLAREALQQKYGLTAEEIETMVVHVFRDSDVVNDFEYLYHFFPDANNPNTLYQVIIAAETGAVLSILYVEGDPSQFYG